jgi:hypothetical protein
MADGVGAAETGAGAGAPGAAPPRDWPKSSVLFIFAAPAPGVTEGGAGGCAGRMPEGWEGGGADAVAVKTKRHRVHCTDTPPGGINRASKSYCAEH